MPQATQPKVLVTQFADGSSVDPRACRDGSAGVQDTHARYLEAVARGNVYSACTPVAGCAPGTALGTALSLCLYNPLNSGVGLSVWKVSWAYVSGTLGAGNIVYCTNNVAGAQAGTVPTGTAMVARNNQIGNGSTPKGLALSAATVVTTSATGILRPVWSIFPVLATTAILPAPMIDEVAGEYEVLPGNIFGAHEIGGAGTSPLGCWGICWEEYPIGVAQAG